MIADSELKYAYPAVITDTSINGGVPSVNLIPSATLKNVFDHVFKSERDNGSTKYRKIFLKLSNANNESLLAAKAWLDNYTAADDHVVLFAGSFIDTMADYATDTEAKYGCAPVKTDVAAGASTVTVTVEAASLASGQADIIFRVGDEIRITTKDDIDDATGLTEFKEISSLSWTGNDCAITVVGTFANPYAIADGARVSSVLSIGDMVPTVDTYVVTSTAGTFDNVGYPVEVDSIGGLYGTVTLTFTDATHYTAAGDNGMPSLGAGTTTADFEPQNTEFSRNICKVPALAFGGTFVAGDTITFILKPPMVGVWEKRVIPALATSLSNNEITLCYTGESA